jgi:hypothetical protein
VAGGGELKKLEVNLGDRVQSAETDLSLILSSFGSPSIHTGQGSFFDVFLSKSMILAVRPGVASLLLQLRQTS